MVLVFHCPESKAYNYTPRLFELTSTTGEFIANEILFPARNNEVEAFLFQQSDLYSAVQPGVCMCVYMCALAPFACLCMCMEYNMWIDGELMTLCVKHMYNSLCMNSAL